jgi:hypothetical protein
MKSDDEYKEEKEREICKINNYFEKYKKKNII